MKKSIKITLKVLAIVLAFALIISSVFIIRSCSAPPEYSEIRARVEELIEASFDVNDVIWGEGLPTYERVESPKREIFETDDTYTDEDGKAQPLNYYYYYVTNIDDEIVAFRREKDYQADFKYAYVSKKSLSKADLASLYPLPEGADGSDELYAEVFADAQEGIFAYLIPYEEKECDFYYSSSDPKNYDYVRHDSTFLNVNAIKSYIRTVYSPDYADSLDQVLFDGVEGGGVVKLPRYDEVDYRGSMLASLNTYEPLFTERRVYLYETAQIDRGSSNDTSVVVEFLTYLPSNPDKKVTASLSFVLDSGVWYLASPTY